MSLLRLNELRVGLCPDRLIIARFRRRFARKLVEQRVVPVKANLPDALKELAANETVTVLLSNHFVRYAVLPWSSTLTSERDWTAFAQHNFASTYGDVAKTWAFCVSRTKQGYPAIACAVDGALLQSLRQIPGIVSVQPYFMAAFNAGRRSFPGPSLWFVVQERGRVTVALVVDGKWKAIRHRQAGEGWREALSDYLDREAAACGDESTDCAVVCSEEELPKQVGRYRILDVSLPRNANLALRPIRMALSA